MAVGPLEWLRSLPLPESLEWLAAVGASGLAAWAAWAKLWKQRLQPWLRARAAREAIAENSRRFQRIQVALHQWRARYAAMRVLALSAQNCGSDWDVEQPVTVSVINEANADDVPRVFERWNQWQADPPYRQMLAHVIGNGDRGHLIKRRDMADSTLRDYYASQGVVASVVFPITVTPDAALIYVSLNFGAPRGEGQEDLPEATQEHYRSRARELWHKNPEAIRAMAEELRAIWRGR